MQQRRRWRRRRIGDHASLALAFTAAVAAAVAGHLSVFKGLTAGVYVDGTGTPFATASTMTANVDFSTRNIGFSTSDMTLANVNNGSRSTRPDLRISGTLTFPSGNSFGGNVTTAHANASDRLTGTASGRFYGPSAHEIGGVYTLSRGPRESMIGAFGGKR